MIRLRALLTGGLFALSVIASAKAAPILDKPVYNPETKSYFEVVDAAYMNSGQGPNWSEASTVASKKSLGKAQGRLGIIPSAKVEMFIRLNLRPDQNMWIGLYYDCGTQSLVWIDGRTLRSGEYTNWASGDWYIGHANMFCNTPDPHMPVLIALSEAERKWAIQLPAKRYHLILIEYPTGGPLNGERQAIAEPAIKGAAKAPVQSVQPPKAAEQTAPQPKTAPKEPAPLVDLKPDNLPPGAGLPRYEDTTRITQEKP
ncbi:C-type lectin domain-containing protein [Govanella unica]|uniref:C-type lectin domain-containing protein n=1 Tax=Govanella unica TaxID=2975056 RepID=A0A9X3TXN4_9PROT|nr:lectin-like protein [Govania unica]MDA5193585.1 hypothetical protein [Govania unica]